MHLPHHFNRFFVLLAYPFNRPKIGKGDGAPVMFLLGASKNENLCLLKSDQEDVCLQPLDVQNPDPALIGIIENKFPTVPIFPAAFFAASPESIAEIASH